LEAVILKSFRERKCASFSVPQPRASGSSLDHCPTPCPISSQSLREVSPAENLKQEETQTKGEAGMSCPLYRVLLHFPEPFS